MKKNNRKNITNMANYANNRFSLLIDDESNESEKETIEVQILETNTSETNKLETNTSETIKLETNTSETIKLETNIQEESEESEKSEEEIVETLKKQIEKESVNMDCIGLTKLNTPWTLWFHHDPNDWNLSGYKKIATFRTVDEYLRIMNHIHMVTSIKTINLYLFREGIEPTWEDDANSNGGFWSIKVSMDTGLGIWKKMCDKAVCETILKTAGDKDINGTVNGITITSKLMNTIVKIWVSDRKVSNNQWIDNEILSNITSKIIYQVISPER